MKKIIVVFLGMILLFSCQKEKCKEQQKKDLSVLIERYQQQISTDGLTAQQIEELTRRFQQEQKEILAECN